MKNIFLVFIILTIIFAIFPFATYADEVTTPEETSVVETTEDTTPAEDVSEMETTTPEEITDVTEPITEPEDKPAEDITDTPTETPTEEPTEPTTSPDDGDAVTFINRIVEAWEKGEIGTVITLALNAATIIFISVLKKSGGKNNLALIATLKNSKDATVGAVNELIDAANNVVKAVEGEDGVKGMIEQFKSDVEKQVDNIAKLDKEKLEQYGKQLADCMATQRLLAEMLQTVYANSTTISMPTKNMIAEKYLEICHKLEGENNG